MTSPDERDALRERMNGDYEVPVLAEPEPGPVPPWQPIDEPPTDQTG